MVKGNERYRCDAPTELIPAVHGPIFSEVVLELLRGLCNCKSLLMITSNSLAARFCVRGTNLNGQDLVE